MKRPVLKEISMYEVNMRKNNGKGEIFITMRQDQWDNILQASYNSGFVLIEIDGNEVPVKAYQK